MGLLGPLLGPLKFCSPPPAVPPPLLLLWSTPHPPPDRNSRLRSRPRGIHRRATAAALSGDAENSPATAGIPAGDEEVRALSSLLSLAIKKTLTLAKFLASTGSNVAGA